MTLQIRELGVKLGGRDLLERISFSACRGELLALIGPNGAGKTTLLRAIAGLLTFQGDVRWDETSLPTLSMQQRAAVLSYLPQGHVAYWPLLARDIVAIGRAPRRASLNGLSAADIRAIDQALEDVGATSFADRPVTELSGGERARIMVARALAAQAPLMLADEPIASLDPEHQLSIMGILARLAKNGHLVIAVVHDLSLAARFADRLVVLKNGRLAGIGAPEDVLNPQLLNDIFNVESRTFVNGDTALHLPWAPAAGPRPSNSPQA